MKTKILALAFVALAPFAASADPDNYSYADVSYQLGTIDPVFDTDGFRVQLSKSFSDNWFASFDYQTMGTDPDVGSIDTYAFYAGWHNDMLFAKLGYASADYAGFDDSGYALDFGARGNVGDNIELNGHVGYQDLGNLDTFTIYGIGAVWMFGDNMGVSFNYDITSTDIGADADQYGVGVRFEFE